MKLRTAPLQNRQGGMAVIVVLALLTLVLIFVAANVRALQHLKREVGQVERQQVRRLAAHPVKEAMPAPGSGGSAAMP